MAAPRKWLRLGRAWALLPLLVALQTGCYTYHPITTASIGDHVRARLTTAEAVRQSEVTGDPTIELEGTVAGVTDERLNLQVITARGQSGLESFAFKTDYSLPRTEIVQLGRRELATWRSVGLGALVGGIIYLILDQTIIGAGGGETPDPGDPASHILNVRPRR